MPFAMVHTLGDGEAQTLRDIDNETCDLCGDTCYPNDEVRGARGPKGLNPKESRLLRLTPLAAA
jgi:hypothetical protein